MNEKEMIKNVLAGGNRRDQATKLIELERDRQVRLGFGVENDDVLTNGELEAAARCYLRNFETRGSFHSTRAPDEWPFSKRAADVGGWRPKNAGRDLIKAGALATAEVARLARAGYETRLVELLLGHIVDELATVLKHAADGEVEKLFLASSRKNIEAVAVGDVSVLSKPLPRFTASDVRRAIVETTRSTARDVILDAVEQAARALEQFGTKEDANLLGLVRRLSVQAAAGRDSFSAAQAALLKSEGRVEELERNIRVFVAIAATRPMDTSDFRDAFENIRRLV